LIPAQAVPTHETVVTGAVGGIPVQGRRAVAPAAPAATADGRAAPIAALLVFVTASGLALQGRLASALAEHIGSIPSIAISNTSGLVPLAAIVFMAAARRAGLRQLLASRPPLWMWGCGLAGTIAAVTSASVIPIIGVAVLGVVMTATQSIAGLGIDRAGIGSTGVMRVSRQRLMGVALVLGAVVVAAVGRGGHLTVPLLAVIVVVGVIGTLPQAANGHLTDRSGSPIVTGFVNFATGAIFIDTLFLLGSAFTSWPQHWPSNIWLYLSGVPSAIFVVIASAAVGRLGVLGVTLATVAGNLCGGLVIDIVSPSNGGGVPVTTVAATALTLAAVAVTTYTRAPRVLR
jgi:transporter family-2 protein